MIYKPSSWSLLILLCPSTNKKTVYINSSTYYFRLAIPNFQSDIRYTSGSSTLSIHTLYLHKAFRSYWASLNSVLLSFWKPSFTKLKFKGKGYYIYKNQRNTITPQFGYSHRLYVYSFFVCVKFLSKTSIFLFGLVRSDILKAGFAIKAMRPINIFTGRGVRFASQIIYRKVGKVSSYR